MAARSEAPAPGTPQLLSAAGLTPIPDPTVLTTQASERAIAALKELMMTKIESLEETIETRLHASDKAVNLLNENSEKIPKLIKCSADQLQELMTEKLSGVQIQFDGVQVQFKERDTRTDQAAATTATAVGAAFAAQKEAAQEQNRSFDAKITKTEGSVIKQLDQISENIRTGDKATDGRINDIKERLLMIESHKKGTGDSLGVVFGIIGTFSGIAAVIGLIISMTAK